MKEKLLAQFLEAMPVGIFVVDKYGAPYYANEKAKEILGKGIIRAADVTELPEIYQAYLTGTTQLYPPERQPIVQALRGIQSSINDMEIHQPDKIVPIEVWGTPVFDESGEIAYAIAAFQDITAHRQAEQERIHFTKRLKDLNKAYERFVPHQFLGLLGKESIIEVRSGDQIEKEMTILFSDIRGFTSISETMQPLEIFDFINHYLGQMEPIILNHRGVIDKYIGDAIMAVFPTSTDDAVNCAIAMLETLSVHNKLLKKAGLPQIFIGIGLNTGSMILGIIGGQSRMDGTVISDAVNVASRLEELTKTYHAPLLITEHTYRALTNPRQYHIRMVDVVRVKGKSKVVTIYEVYDTDPPETKILKDQTLETFKTGFALYYAGEFADAQRAFEEVLRIYNHDEIALIYLHRCQDILGLTAFQTATILIVDDSLMDVKILSHILIANQFNILVARNGESALSIVKSQPIHLILLDIMMPGLDGFETCQRLKKQSYTKDIPVIFISGALINRADIVKAFKVGAIDYIIKPFHREDVLSRVKVHLNNHYLRQQLIDRYDYMMEEGDYCQL